MTLTEQLKSKKLQLREELRAGLHISRQYERGLREAPKPTAARDYVVRMPSAAKLTSERALLICESLRVGAHPTTAAQNAGVSPTSLSNWIKRGRADREQGEPTPYAQLVSAMEKATAEAEIHALENIQAAADDDPKFWQANTWLLEHRFGKRWKNVQQVAVSGPGGGPVQHQVAVLMVDADKLRAARALTEGVIGVLPSEIGDLDPDSDVLEGEVVEG